MKPQIISSFCIILCLLCSKCLQHNHTGSVYTELGHYLFFDTRLSVNGTKSCASCHDPSMAFTDGYHRSIGADGDIHQRNSPTLVNAGDQPYLTAADSTVRSFEQQVIIPLFNHRFVELGNDSSDSRVLTTLKHDPLYRQLLRANTGNREMNWLVVEKALSVYCRSLVSRNSKYDRVVAGVDHFDQREARGFKLFTSAALHCNACHGGRDFNRPNNTARFYTANGFFLPDSSHAFRKFFNEGGLFNLTQQRRDIGRFRIPTLRNCALTAPYMHDGSVSDLDSVLHLYATGGYIHSPHDSLITGFKLEEGDGYALKSFLQALTDTSYVNNPIFMDPFKETKLELMFFIRLHNMFTHVFNSEDRGFFITRSDCDIRNTGLVCKQRVD